MTDNTEIYLNQVFEEQADMTAVEEFALKKDFLQLPREVARYQKLIPKNRPGPGEQYAFEVNLDQCTGCKACVTACHNENGLDADETWRSVALLHGTTSQGPAIQHVTGACHHCLDPACMNGCPVNAYEKDPGTGVVKHLDDQCIGCQYCILKCPYDVPKFSKKKGIVHKCDMCISRLNVGEAPACVRACPSEAIRITLVDTQKVQQAPSEFVNLPQSPDPSYTKPTTRYVSQKNFPNDMTTIDAAIFKPEHPHLPLIVMLVLTQLSVGTFLAGGIAQQIVFGALREILTPVWAWTALGVSGLALGASLFHLGRPHLAFRAILGFKTSWLSREIIAFGGFAGFAAIFAVETNLSQWPCSVDHILAGTALVCGLAGVFASVMVYRDTRRELWASHWTTFKFFMTTLILGTASMTAVSVTAVSAQQSIFADICDLILMPGTVILAVLNSFKILVEARIFSFLRQPEMNSFKKSAMLMTGPLKKWTQQRFIYGVVGGVVMPVFLWGIKQFLTIPEILIWIWVMVMMNIMAEMLERYLFFRAVIPLKMPH